jgi:hypothetical protein
MFFTEVTTAGIFAEQGTLAISSPISRKSATLRAFFKLCVQVITGTRKMKTFEPKTLS